MEPCRVIFVSAVSNEFHKVPPDQRHLFNSYRDILKQAFRVVAPHYEVVVQEDLTQGFGDLLETLDHEIARSLFVVHLVGELAGTPPEPAPVQGLFARHPDLLAAFPDLQASIGGGAGITYTQWELYLAYHHGKRRLIFEASPDTARSPSFTRTQMDQSSQHAHRRRIESTGDHRGPFLNQGDVARKSIRSFLHFRIDPTVDAVEPSAAAVADAWSHREDIVEHLAAQIKKPDACAVPVSDPANAAAFVAALRSAASRWRVNLATIVDVAARHEEELRAAVEHRPTPQALYDQAFAEMALGDYTAARFTARRAADLALRERRSGEKLSPDGVAQNALLLVHEAAKAAHDMPAAMSALEEAGALVDKETDPLVWAEIHEPIASFLLDQAKLDRAEEVISDLVDIREAHQGENSPELGQTLLLWSNLLGARANWPGMESVAARAERIFASQNPPHLSGAAAAMNNRAMAMKEQHRMAEAEPLLRRVLAIDQKVFGPEHPQVAAGLNNLALLLLDTNRLAEAEPLMRQAQSIWEKSLGAEHPQVATALSNLALLLQNTNRPAEAEPLSRRALMISEKVLDPNHPDVALRLGNLATLLQETNRCAEAEPMHRRALAIREKAQGHDHPDVARDLNNLAHLLIATNRPGEAEPLMRRALQILLNFSRATGHPHPHVGNVANAYANLLGGLGRSEGQIRSELTALGIQFQAG